VFLAYLIDQSTVVVEFYSSSSSVLTNNSIASLVLCCDVISQWIAFIPPIWQYNSNRSYNLGVLLVHCLSNLRMGPFLIKLFRKSALFPLFNVFVDYNKATWYAGSVNEVTLSNKPAWWLITRICIEYMTQTIILIYCKNNMNTELAKLHPPLIKIRYCDRLRV